MGTAVLVVVVIVLAIVCLVTVVKMSEAKHKARDEWLEALLDPSVSLATLVHSLNTVYPSVFTSHGCDPWDHRVGDWGYHSKINLRNTNKLFSDRMMWQLIDVFVRNAQQHFSVLSNNFKDGESLVRHIMTEIMLLWGSNAMNAINHSSLSEEAKQKLLS